MKRMPGRLLWLTAAMAAGSAVCSGYYHYVRFNTRVAPFTPVFEKFDLSALPGRRVAFFISEQAPAQLHPSDSFPALVSQIRLAAGVWNSVETSELRLTYGGLVAPDTQHASPVIEVMFSDEIAPGIVALGGPTVRADFNGSFVPIQKSVVILNRDLSQRPSYSEDFFGTLVHEFGHAIGLQHTLTSSAMSTKITRSTTRARPLAADDLAGISVLYPAASFGLATGGVSGRVTRGNAGVNLASVVAIMPNGPALSALTNPDGTYRIDGLAPGQYLVYVHPLPPPLTSQGETSPANLWLPLDADRRSLSPGPNFDTVFYPGVRDPQQAFPIAVAAGVNNENIDFSVRARGHVQLHSVQTYGFPGSVTVKPPYLNPQIQRPFIVAAGTGLVSDGALVSDLTVTTINGRVLPAKSYAPAPAFYAQMDVDVSSFTFGNEGPRHMIFASDNDIYVLPSGYFQVQQNPPSITTVAAAPEGNRTVLISGANLQADTRVLFDGVPAAVRGVDDAGRLVAVAPPATAGYRAAVVVLNSDGQSSLFAQSEPAFYSYEALEAAAGGIIATPASVPAGADALVTIDGVNTNFADGQVAVGFGSADVAVRRVFVVSPTRLLVNISVAGSAVAGTTTLTVNNGLQLLSVPFGFQVPAGAAARTVSLGLGVVNAVTGQAAIYPNSSAVLTVRGAVTLSGAALALTLNDRPVSITSITGNQITFQVPAGMPVGPAVLRLQVGGDSSLPIAIVIESPPPQILGVTAGENQAVEPSRPARPGQILSIQVAGLAEAGASVALARLIVNVGGVDLPALQVVAAGQNHQVLFFVPLDAPTGPRIPLTVSYAGRTSQPYNIPIRGL
ncbi:MAG: IPT/TIG domain-containing protein [Acidobacteria bacterium]|nr:IPT/TIG domain-containing protein [Acidobacteriota bacterium]